MYILSSENSLGTSEESGKDWSELEEEAAAADKTRTDFVDDYTQRKNKGSSHHRDRDRDRDHRRSKPPPPKKHSSGHHSSVKNGSHSSMKRSRDESRDKHHKKMRK